MPEFEEQLWRCVIAGKRDGKQYRCLRAAVRRCANPQCSYAGRRLICDEHSRLVVPHWYLGADTPVRVCLRCYQAFDFEWQRARRCAEEQRPQQCGLNFC